MGGGMNKSRITQKRRKRRLPEKSDEFDSSGAGRAMEQDSGEAWNWKRWGPLKPEFNRLRKLVAERGAKENGGNFPYSSGSSGISGGGKQVGRGSLLFRTRGNTSRVIARGSHTPRKGGSVNEIGGRP